MKRSSVLKVAARRPAVETPARLPQSPAKENE